MMGTRDHPAQRVASSTTRDAALAGQIRDRYWKSGYLALREITCTCRDGIVRLRGRLPSYYLKQVAQAIPLGMRQVRTVVNRIAVLAPAARRQTHDRDRPPSAPARLTGFPPEPGAPPAPSRAGACPARSGAHSERVSQS